MKGIATEAIEQFYEYSKERGYDMERSLEAVQNTFRKMFKESNKSVDEYEIETIMKEVGRVWKELIATNS